MWGYACHHRLPDGVEEVVRGHSFVRVHAILRTPVRELSPHRGDQAGDGMPSEADQLTQHVLPDSRVAFRRQAGLRQEAIQRGQERRWVLFFLMRTGDGGACLRWRIKLALSSIIHSTTSPFSNSIAWATAEGYLVI